MNAGDIFGSGIINVAIFYISIYVSYIITYYAISFFVDKSNRVSLLRIGVAINLVLLLVLVFMGSSATKYVAVAGILYGVSDGFYYSCYLVMKNELSGKKSIKQFNVFNIVFTYLTKIIIPIVLGFLIDESSYSQMALCVIVFSVAQFITTFFIHSNKPTDSKFEPVQYHKFLKQNPEVKNKIKYTYINHLFGGVKNTYSIIVVILTIYTFKTNLNLGLFTAAFSVISMLLVALYKRFDKHPKLNKKIIYLILGIVPVVACVILIFSLNKVTLIIYNLIITISVCFCGYLDGCERDAIIKNIGKDEYIAEHQFSIEFIQCCGRILAYIVMVLVGLISNILAFKILLFVYLLFNPIKVLIMYKQRKIRKGLEEENNNPKLQNEIKENSSKSTINEKENCNENTNNNQL